MSQSQVYIGRQPILDSHKNLFAYELRFYQGMNPNQNSIKETSELINRVQSDVGFQSVVGSYPSMLHMPYSLLTPESIPEIDSDHLLVLEVSTEVLKDVEALKNLKTLKMQGYHFLLDDYLGDEAGDKLATITGFAKIKLRRFSTIELRKQVQNLHSKGIKVIADLVDTEEQFEHFKQMGFDYFLGYFFTNPIMANGQKLSGNKLNLLQLLAKVNAVDSGFEELSEIISQDVGLSHKLLVAINNPANDIPVRVEKVSDALKYMGLKRLKFWVNLLMLSRMDDVPAELLTTSLLNAKFCELMAEQSGFGSDKNAFFLVGMLSNLDAYFRAPIEEIVEALPLSDELNNALVLKQGPMGEVLQILQVMQNQPEDAEDLTFKTLSIVQISNNFLSASAWAQQAYTS